MHRLLLPAGFSACAVGTDGEDGGGPERWVGGWEQDGPAVVGGGGKEPQRCPNAMPRDRGRPLRRRQRRGHQCSQSSWNGSRREKTMCRVMFSGGGSAGSGSGHSPAPGSAGGSAVTAIVAAGAGA